MPTYEYRCENCGHELEIFQSIRDRALRKCPQCGKNGLRRLIGTGAGVIFKGSGFYQTDYRSESYKAGEKQAKDGGKPADAKKGDSPAKTEAKADSTKTESKAPAEAASKKKTA
ncbi:MAG TPA: zinc ribbon domain-containing protein [Phycisphaerales bacterium]|nr:zinc ribbon domain-containing protein [Phycisphaerales bacterium]